jgi:hypothetical protein
MAGGETYFRNVVDEPFKKAKKLFTSHIKTLAEEEALSKGKVLTAGERTCDIPRPRPLTRP